MSQPEIGGPPQEEVDAKPVIPASTLTLPEITFKAVALGFILSVVLAGANAYLGLFAGMTVSASIPAAVVSMAVLRAFKRSNILENNLVQTAASAGESLAAGVIFTVPALVLLGYWQEFDYWEVTAIALVGGLVGVLFTIPLRRALVVEEGLLFPEGIATAEVLKTGGAIRDSTGATQAEHPELVGIGGSEETQRRSIRALATAGLVGAFVKFSEAGMLLWSGTLEVGARAIGTVWVVGINLSPALVSVGYIVGLNIATLVFGGGVIAWLLAIPIYVARAGIPAGFESATAVEIAGQVWTSQIRYMGVGAMVVGGLWALINLMGPVKRGIAAGLAAYSASGPQAKQIKRTELDMNMKWVLLFTAACIIPIFWVYEIVVQQWSVSIVMAAIMLVAGFFFAAVAGYMAGLVGSSNNPISGVTIATLLFTSALLLALLGADSPVGPAAAIFVGAVVACAAAISGDTMQDLKAGHIVGATPWKQQVLEFIGVISAAFVMSPVLFLLQARYGIGAPTPEHPEPLTAPQATLMASVAEGVFRGGLPWTMVIIGGAIGVALIISDKMLEARGSEFRTPVLAVAVGIYLPLELTSSIFIGGIIAWLASRRLGGKEPHQTGLLFASGLITGEALVGILLALPIVLGQVWPFFSGDMFEVFAAPPLGGWPGLIVIAGVAYWLYSLACQPSEES
ncbi:MAG: oligopeptide transporter, OPT family [Acidobacteriota bacterium]